MSYDPPPPRGGPSGPPPRPRVPPPGPEEVTQVAPSWDDPAPRAWPAPERGSRHYDEPQDEHYDEPYDAPAPGPRGYGDPETRSGHLDPDSRSGHLAPEPGGRRRLRDEDVAPPERSGGRRRRRDEDDEPSLGGYVDRAGYVEQAGHIQAGYDQAGYDQAGYEQAGYDAEAGHVEPGGRRRAPDEPAGPPPAGPPPGGLRPGGRRRAAEDAPEPGGRRRAPEPVPPPIPLGTPPGGLPRTPPGPGTPPGGMARTPPGTPPDGLPMPPPGAPGGLPRTPPGTPPGGMARMPPSTPPPGTPPGGMARMPPGTPPGGPPTPPPGTPPGGMAMPPGTPPGGMPRTPPGTPPGSMTPPGTPPGGLPRTPGPGAPSGALGRRLNGEPEPQTPGRRPHPGPPPADATRYTSAFSGSLPPSGAPARPPRPRPVDPPTEIIKPVDDHEDDYDDEYDDYEDYEDDDYEDDEPPPPKDSAGRKTVRTVGELLITFGLVILLFVVYEVYITDLISAGKQDDATSALDDKWGANTVQADPQRQAQYDLVEGEAFAKMYIPAFGPDFKFSVVEGTSDKHLEIGPGHYVNTALPGAPGNFAVAGHRVGKGAPFNDLDLLNACDAIVVETQTEWFVYRMLPKASEVAGWAQSDKVKDPKCGKVSPLGAPYDKTVGQEIVLPTQGEVIDPVPHFEGEVPQAQQVALLTLTTCHPRFSDRQRLIVHAVLTQGYPKAEGFVPEELKEQ
ncbi:MULTISPECIES: class E sortase [unclassified Saccharothrix]|uniref:class E sortase n=1 Tax=unclassified Saccharothrix TaxID=2593673 RepID=UPI00307F94EC